MQSFKYARPESLPELLELLEKFRDRARLISGGTDLLVKLQHGNLAVEVVIDIKRVAELSDRVVTTNGWVSIGPRAVIGRVVRHPGIESAYPALVEAGRIVGSVQIRNRATVAGNICTASPAADTVPPLCAYDARIRLVSTEGSREVPLRSFFVGPGKTVIAPNEVLAEIRVPAPHGAMGSSFDRITRRRGVDLATINIAGVLHDNGTAVFAFGAVAPTVVVAEETSGDLCDPTVSADRVDEVLKTLLATARPISDVRSSKEYREAMLLVAARRVQRTALERLTQARGGRE